VASDGLSVEIGDELQTEWKTVETSVADWIRDLHSKLEEVVEEYTDKVFDEAVREVPVDTGNLRSTIEQIFEKKALEVIRGLVGTKKTDYAHHVHFGTFKMEARPFLKDALKKHAKDFVKAVVKTVTDHAKKARQYKKNT